MTLKYARSVSQLTAVIIPLILLSACGSSDAESAQAKAAKPMGVRPAASLSAGAASQPNDWAGKYQGNFDGGKGFVDVNALPNRASAYAVELTVAGSDGCSGTVKGEAVSSGDRLTLRVPVPDEAETCVVNMTRAGARMSVAASGCMYFSGMSCGFDGSVARIGGANYSPSMADGSLAPTAAWLVGNWVVEGGYCASGGPLIFSEQGGYGNSGGDIEGRWSLTEGILNLNFAEVDFETGRTVGPTTRSKIKVTRVNTNEMMFDNTSRLRRCSPLGGAEPWHPGERFTTK